MTQEEGWDWGQQGKSPDLDHLRMFFAKECKLMLQERDLLDLFLHVASNEDDLDGSKAAKELFTHAHRATRIAPVRITSMVGCTISSDGVSKISSHARSNFEFEIHNILKFLPV